MCKLYYLNSTATRVEINGTASISDQLYDTYFVKDYDDESYNMTLHGQEDSVLDFSNVQTVIFQSMGTLQTTILPGDFDSTNRLARFNITETLTEVQDPYITIIKQPYLMVRVDGLINTPVSTQNFVRYSGEFTNLDGDILSYNRFIFSTEDSEAAFLTLFDVSSVDAGYRSMNINGFQFITVNRDFNLRKIMELQNTNILLPADQDVIAKEGISVQLTTGLIND